MAGDNGTAAHASASATHGWFAFEGESPYVRGAGSHLAPYYRRPAGPQGRRRREGRPPAHIIKVEAVLL